MKIRICVMLLLAAMAGACSTGAPVSSVEGSPDLAPETFFSGPLLAQGLVKDRGGNVIRRFSAQIDASWEDGVGTLDERFVFDDGEKQTRIWTLRADGSGAYLATAGDVVGEGTMRQNGNTLLLDYVLRIPYKGSTVDVHVDDRMYLLSPDLIVNESVMKKFGFRVGSILLVITRGAEDTDAAMEALRSHSSAQGQG